MTVDCAFLQHSKNASSRFCLVVHVEGLFELARSGNDVVEAAFAEGLVQDSHQGVVDDPKKARLNLKIYEPLIILERHQLDHLASNLSQNK